MTSPTVPAAGRRRWKVVPPAPRRFPSITVLAGLVGALLAVVPTTADAQWVWIGSDRIVRVNGGRFFPVGLLELGIDRYPDDWNQMIRDSGANCVWDNGFAYVDSVPPCEAIRDSSLAAGYHVVTGSPDTWEWDDPETPEFEVDQPMFDSSPLNSLDECFPGFTTHLGYANRDEPVWTISREQVGDIDSAHVHDTYDQLKDQDSFKVVAMNFAPAHLSGDLETWKADILSFVDATDVVMLALYPYPSGPGTCGEYNVVGYPDCTMDRLWQSADIFVNELLQEDQAFWMIVQAFKGVPLGVARWEATQAIIHGATGLLWGGWTWSHPLGPGIESWPVTRQVVSEFAGLHDALVGATIAGYSAGVPDIDVLAKEDPDGEAVLFAASRHGFSGLVSITVPSGVSSEWVQVLYEDRHLAIDEGGFTDSFFGTVSSHVYRVMPAGFVPVTGVPVASPPEDDRVRIRVFPNPARGSVTASFSAPGRGPVEVRVYDVAGRFLDAATVRSTGAGTGIAEWAAQDGGGRPAPAGVYFLRAVAATGEAASARVLLR